MSGRFSNPWGPREQGIGGVLKWKLGLAGKRESSGAPDLPAEWVAGIAAEAPAEGWRVTSLVE